EGMIVGTVGDISQQDILHVLGPLVKDWKSAKSFVVEPNTAVDAVTTPMAKVATPGKPNAVSLLLQPIRLSATAPDYMALDAAAFALFQNPSSRIARKVREEAALSYPTNGGFVGSCAAILDK